MEAKNVLAPPKAVLEGIQLFSVLFLFEMPLGFASFVRNAFGCIKKGTFILKRMSNRKRPLIRSSRLASG